MIPANGIKETTAASSPDTSIYSPTSPTRLLQKRLGLYLMYWHNTENTSIYKKSLDVYQNHVTSRLEKHAINEQSLHVNGVKAGTNYVIT